MKAIEENYKFGNTSFEELETIFGYCDLPPEHFGYEEQLSEAVIAIMNKIRSKLGSDRDGQKKAVFDADILINLVKTNSFDYLGSHFDKIYVADYVWNTEIKNNTDEKLRHLVWHIICPMIIKVQHI